MSAPFKQRFNHWLLGLNRAAVQGGAIAAKTYFCMAGAHQAGLPVEGLNLRQAAVVWFMGAVYHFNDYLAENPLPQICDLPAATPTPETK